MFEIERLCKKYGELSVYENFNLAVKEGRILGVLGESGSGKTTLLNCIAGLTKFDGNIPKLKCSYVFQSPRLVPNLTVRQNLQLVCKDEGRVDDMLAKVNLGDKADSYPVSLSGGQAQRVSLARAFLFESDIILMDEPLSSLDLKLKRQLLDLFLSIWLSDKRMAIYVTHDIDEAISVSHRIIILRGGEITCDISLPQEPLRCAERFPDLREKLISHLL